LCLSLDSMVPEHERARAQVFETACPVILNPETAFLCLDKDVACAYEVEMGLLGMMPCRTRIGNQCGMLLTVSRQCAVQFWIRAEFWQARFYIDGSLITLEPLWELVHMHTYKDGALKDRSDSEVYVKSITCIYIASMSTSTVHSVQSCYDCRNANRIYTYWAFTTPEWVTVAHILTRTPLKTCIEHDGIVANREVSKNENATSRNPVY
jgi:hypothetical protein